MLKGFDKNGILRDVLVTEDGKLVVESENSGGSVSTIIENTSESPVPVEIKNLEIEIDSTDPVNVSGSVSINDVETTLQAGVVTVGTTEQTIGVNAKVTEISIANYSETANIAISIDQTSYVIAPNLAMDLPINKTVGTIGLSSTEADTKVQYVIKGVDA